MAEQGRTYAGESAAERRAQRKLRLLDAGLDLFATVGWQDTTVQQLCSSARVSTRTFYEEFGGREELLIALHDELNDRAHRAVVDAVQPLPVTSFAARAHAGMRAYVSVMTTDPRWARIALVESVGASPDVDDHRRIAIERFAMLLQAELDATAAAGVIPARDFSLAVVGLVGAINQLIMSWTSQPDWDAVVEDVIAEGARFVTAVGHHQDA